MLTLKKMLSNNNFVEESFKWQIDALDSEKCSTKQFLQIVRQVTNRCIQQVNAKIKGEVPRPK